ncbi:MAG: transporter substrate-binding domain-containing protein [Firmicutes bacterium]|nr:transporter substrate-binding domain-containing protein [Bacillota bacterium]
MKKILSILMAALMCVAMAACGSQNASETSTESDWAYVQNKGVVTIGVTNYPPMNYLNDNGDWMGFDTEFAQAVFESLGVDVEFVEISWEAKETELQSKNIDCLWNGMCITDERKEMWEVSTPYMYNTQAMVMKADREAEIMADVTGLNIVAEAGSTGEEKITGKMDDDSDPTVEVKALDYFANSNYTGVESMATALMDVENGIADVAVVDSVIAQGMIEGENSSYGDLVINMDNKFGDQYFGVAFRKDSDICEMVNGAIETLRENGKLDEIAAKYGLTDSVAAAANAQ